MCTCLQTTVCICCKTIVISVVIDAMVVFNSNVSDAIVVVAMFLGVFARLPSKLRLVRKREDRKRPSVVHSKPSDF
jgi:L-serine deaminase